MTTRNSCGTCGGSTSTPKNTSGSWSPATSSCSWWRLLGTSWVSVAPGGPRGGRRVRVPGAVNTPPRPQACTQRGRCSRGGVIIIIFFFQQKFLGFRNQNRALEWWSFISAGRRGEPRCLCDHLGSQRQKRGRAVQVDVPECGGNQSSFCVTWPWPGVWGFLGRGGGQSGRMRSCVPKGQALPGWGSRERFASRVQRPLARERVEALPKGGKKGEWGRRQSRKVCSCTETELKGTRAAGSEQEGGGASEKSTRAIRIIHPSIYPIHSFIYLRYACIFQSMLRFQAREIFATGFSTCPPPPPKAETTLSARSSLFLSV